MPVLDGAPADGSRGDGGLVDAGAGWCASHGTGHTFCEDFLTGVPDQLVEYAVNGAIAANTSDYESPPQSMAASVPMLAKGASAIAFASHDLSKATGTQFAVSAYFRGASCFPANGPQSGNTASVLAFNFTDSNYQIVVAVSPTSVELIEITADADGGNQKLQPQSVQSTGLLDTWQDWTLSVDGSALLKTATLTVGNETLFDKVNLKNAPPIVALQHPLVYLGLEVKNGGNDVWPACTIDVDDILIDVHAVAVAGAN